MLTATDIADPLGPEWATRSRPMRSVFFKTFFKIAVLICFAVRYYNFLIAPLLLITSLDSSERAKVGLGWPGDGVSPHQLHLFSARMQCSVPSTFGLGRRLISLSSCVSYSGLRHSYSTWAHDCTPNASALATPHWAIPSIWSLWGNWRGLSTWTLKGDLKRSRWKVALFT